MELKTIVVRIFAALALIAHAAPASATDWFVAAGATGTGTSTSPFGKIQTALNKAQPGDAIIIRPGTYAEPLVTVRGGWPGAPIVVRAERERGSVVITVPGRVIRIDHPHVTLEGLVLDGQYGAADTVDVNNGADFLTIRNTEVRRSSKDLIDIGSPEGVLIEGCLIHHALNATGGRTDAHGIVASAVQGLTIRDTEVHTFSGDGLQVDPGRLAPGWNRVVVEGSRFWLEPLPAAANGFAKGAVPGENAIDTKAAGTLARATLEIRDTTAWGFRGGLIANMAAFNLKENVSVIADRVMVYDSELAFRMRGPTGGANGGAHVIVTNAVVHNTTTAFRYENDPEQIQVWNTTVGLNVTRAFQAASSSSVGLEVRNVAIIGARPAVAAHPSNLSVTADAFVNAAAGNYALAPGSPAIDAGVWLTGVNTDRAGTPRPQGVAPDVGAYEWVPPKALPDDIVIHASKASAISGGWRVMADATAAGGYGISQPDAGLKAEAIQAFPLHYFDVTAWVEAGRPYRLWVRGRAEGDSLANDSAYVQFSGSIDAAGLPVYRIGTTSATAVNIANCPSCPLLGWGWADNGYGRRVLGPTIQFAKTGFQTVRVQTRDDGLTIDQIVLSPSAYLMDSPGLTKGDSTILPES